MKKDTKIVLDTSIFVNPSSRCFFGKTPDKALSNFLETVSQKKNISCYIPPSVYEELLEFIENKPPAEKLTLLNKTPPSSYQSSVPALLFYDFIDQIRTRMNKGLRICEKYTRKGLHTPYPADKKSSSEKDMVKNLRAEYRMGVREGIIDSKQDFDLILLAKELNGYLATADNGLLQWAYKLGITCVGAENLRGLVK